MKRQTMKRAPGASYTRRVPVMIKTAPETRNAVEQLAKNEGITLSFYISNLLEAHVRRQAKKAAAQ